MYNYPLCGYYSRYNSPLSPKAMAKRYEKGYASSSKTATDAFLKNKSTGKKQDNSGLMVAGLAAASLFVGYKGKNVIKKGINACAKAFKGIGASFAKHCPNMANAGSSFAKACSSPFRGIKNIFHKVKK